MTSKYLRAGALSLAVLICSLGLVAGADAAKLKGGNYAGKIKPTDSDSTTDIKFRVNRKGNKITRMDAPVWYGCFVGGSYTLQYYKFTKSPIRIRRNGRFAAKEVVNAEAGFVVKLSGQVKGRTRTAGRMSVDTNTAGGGCEREYTWKASRK